MECQAGIVFGAEKGILISFPSAWAVCQGEMDIPKSVLKIPRLNTGFLSFFYNLVVRFLLFKVITVRMGDDILVTGWQPKLKTAVPLLSGPAVPTLSWI